mmetsp:Transcript_47889/g.143032  ORF Transcript_47889/g.143032 Transcript_47889/m.143032 type:complete len:133 (+) Transcript_47889:309-707(+)
MKIPSLSFSNLVPVSSCEQRFMESASAGCDISNRFHSGPSRKARLLSGLDKSGRRHDGECGNLGPWEGSELLPWGLSVRASGSGAEGCRWWLLPALGTLALLRSTGATPAPRKADREGLWPRLSTWRVRCRR